MRIARKMSLRGAGAGYLHTAGLMRGALRPVEPPPRLAGEIRKLGQAFGIDDTVLEMEEGLRRRRRGLIIGGVCSTLPICGMAAYALARHYLRHGASGTVEAMESENGLMTPA